MGVFDTTVCAVDGSEASLAAVRQADALAPPGARLALVAVAEPVLVAAPVGIAAPVPLVEQETLPAAEDAIARARVELAPTRTVSVSVLEGPKLAVVRRVLDEERATLVAFGVHRRSRLAGIAIGSLGTALLHEARCAVLAARERPDGSAAPRTVVVGVDGSLASMRAVDAAVELSRRCHARLTCLVGGTHPLETRVARQSVELEWPALAVREERRDTVDALAEAEADLIVLGSRGLHGARALGSVSERVAHRATCSVLVVR